MVNEQRQNGRERCQINKITLQKLGYFKYVYVCTRGDVRRIEKLIIRSTRTKLITPSKCHEIFFVH